jgi:hypothetical protein
VAGLGVFVAYYQRFLLNDAVQLLAMFA